MIPTNPKIHGLILAGGYSRRMGQDKVMLNFHGVPQFLYLYHLLKNYCDQVFISKRPDQNSLNDLPFINDDLVFQHKGPLAAILSAMKVFPKKSWLVVACDLPGVNADTLNDLFSQRDFTKVATAFLGSQDNLPEPLCAIWEGHAFDQILNLYYEGINCPRKVLIKSTTHLIKARDAHWLDNINTIEDLQKFKTS